MNKLIQAIEMVRQKLPGLRRHSLKETPTRTIVVDPLLEALGWDVRDPDEVQLEYPTVDNKSVDYALKINRTPVLLVEAKALEDTLDDVKAVTQVCGYAANDGIVWCILTNGILWRIYRSVERCPAPDKMMYEVNLDPNAPEGMAVEQIGRQMWRFSREELARGTLDELGEKTFGSCPYSGEGISGQGRHCVSWSLARKPRYAGGRHCPGNSLPSWWGRGKATVWERWGDLRPARKGRPRRCGSSCCLIRTT